YDNLPKINKLRELVQRSFTVPAWLANPESPEYPYRVHKDLFRESVEELADRVSAPPYTKDEDDMPLSADVEGCLPNLLQIVRQVDALQAAVMGFEPMEADRRYPMDTLGSLVWDAQSDRLTYRVGRKLQIPGPLGYTAWTKPDACAFIQILKHPILKTPTDLKSALSCFPRVGSKDPDCRFILHWVTGFKRGGQEKLSKQQVVEGLVTALYQRRALGFPNHFVFGTAHHSQVFLEVLAATWIPSEPVDSGVDSKQEVDPQTAAPPLDQENDPAAHSSLRGGTTGGASRAGQNLADEGANLTAKDIKKYNEIVVYSIAKYSMRLVEDLLRLYLLMRQTRIFAYEYKAEIAERSKALIKELSEEAKDIYQWPPPPLPEPDQGSCSTTSKRPRTDTLPEEEDSMSVDEYDDSDSGSDQEEPDSASDVGCKHGVAGNGYVHTVTGDVATYTIKNYAYEGNGGAEIVGDPYIAR
ncbi:hypothetical protein FRC11_012186, partial [Ceratobasidium sp. 423]